MLSLESFEGWVGRHWLLVLFVFSCLPGLVVLLRGSVWGADSFAFWAVSCGQSEFAVNLGSPVWFIWFIQNVVSCNLLVLVFFMSACYFLALLGLYFFSRKWFGVNAWRVSLYAATLTPLFFVEGMRFENDFFGWSLGFVAVGLFCLGFQKKDWFAILLSVVIACFSIDLWLPSVFIVALALFFVPLANKIRYLVVCLGIILVLIVQWRYLLHSFTQGIGINAVSEEVPLIGLVFILHILHFYKKIPIDLKFYGWFLLIFGALKSKYMFMVTPLLLMGLLDKELKEGLSIPKLGIQKVPIMFFVCLLGIGWFFMGLNMSPTQTDLKEMRTAIQLAQHENIPLYNDWGDGWTFVSLGYDTNYKITAPNPDWNNLGKPFVAYTKQKLDCKQFSKKIYVC